MRVAPARLDFGRVALGASHQLALELTNAGTAPVDVRLTTSAPFQLETASLRLERGGAATVAVRFVPSALGAADGSATLTWGEATVQVALSGEGLPACTTSNQCADVAFDLESRSCVERPSPRRPCSQCVDEGFCEAGVCVGAAAGCDDHDACTTDACSFTLGCLHTPVECPVLDACRVAYCSPDAGCGSSVVEDGTPCGPEDCRSAHLCLAGTCARRERPNADANCAYQAVAASGSAVCALTVAGGLKCWGSVGPRSANAPHLIADHGFVSLHGGTRALCAIDAAGHPLCLRGGPDGGLGGPLRALSAVSPLAVLESGELQRWNWQTGAVEPPFSVDDAGVLAASSDALWIGRALATDLTCWLARDGGIGCDGLDLSSLQLPPASDLRQLEVRLLCAQTMDGPRCWHTKPQLSAALLDAGAGDVVGSRGSAQLSDQLCVASGPSLACEASSLFPALSASFPSPVRQLTSGSFSLCALTSPNDIYCVGDNFEGELGDDSVLPVGTVERSVPGGVRVLAVNQGTTAAANDAGIWFWGAGDPEPRLRWAKEDVRDLAFSSEGLCALDSSGVVECWQDDAGARVVAQGALRLDPSWAGPCAVLDGGTVLRLPQGRPWRLTGIAQVGGSCALTQQGDVLCMSAARGLELSDCVAETDGGHSCNGSPHPPMAIPRRAIALSNSSIIFQNPAGEGCALLVDDEVWCWRSASDVPAQVLGVLYPRQVVGSAAGGCALSGLNGVQCWGTNAWGLLANSMPSSVNPVWIPMPERIVSRLATPARSSRRDGCGAGAPTGLASWAYPRWSPRRAPSGSRAELPL